MHHVMSEICLLKIVRMLTKAEAQLRMSVILLFWLYFVGCFAAVFVYSSCLLAIFVTLK